MTLLNLGIVYILAAAYVVVLYGKYGNRALLTRVQNNPPPPPRYYRKALYCALIVATACLGLGCAGSATLNRQEREYYESMPRTAGDGESEIVVTRPSKFTGLIVPINIFINGEQRLALDNGTTSTVIVPNGRHTICGRHGMAKTDRCPNNTVSMELTSSRAVVQSRFNPWGMDGLWASVRMTELVQFPLDGAYAPLSTATAAPPSASYYPPPETTVASAEVPVHSGGERPKIAVYVADEDIGVNKSTIRALATRLLEAFVNSGRYTAVERSEAFVAEISREQHTQRSGAVDDEQISRLGRQSGVQFVCVANITHALGSYQVSARIIDVETANVTAIGVADSPLQVMNDLTAVSQNIVAAMFGSIAAARPDPKTPPETRRGDERGKQENAERGREVRVAQPTEKAAREEVRRGTSFGIRAGAILSNDFMESTRSSNYWNVRSGDPVSLVGVGYDLGLITSTRFTRAFSINSGLNVYSKGSITSLSDPGLTEWSIAVPLLIQWDFGRRKQWYMQHGAVAQFPLSTKLSYSADFLDAEERSSFLIGFVAIDIGYRITQNFEIHFGVLSLAPMNGVGSAISGIGLTYFLHRPH